MKKLFVIPFLLSVVGFCSMMKLHDESRMTQSKKLYPAAEVRFHAAGFFFSCHTFLKFAENFFGKCGEFVAKSASKGQKSKKGGGLNG